MTRRPEVRVETMTDAAGIISHCKVHVGNTTIQAPFNQSSERLCEAVNDAANVTLRAEEVMVVTNAARAQMEQVADHLKQELKSHPVGTVAPVSHTLRFWLDSTGALLWAESSRFTEEPDEVFADDITAIGEIDTDELFEVTESIRGWLKTPIIESVDPAWLARLSGNLETSHD